MKIRSLLLGSVAAAGLSTGAYAADLGVLTSLDVCDALGLSGLTISSDTNCLQISGGVSYEFAWGDFRGESTASFSPFGNNNIPTRNLSTGFVPVGPGVDGDDLEEFSHDWDSKVETWLRVVATADSDFGPARAVIGLRQVDHIRHNNSGYADGEFGLPSAVTGGDHFPLAFDEAYVSVGDSTVLMAGLKRIGINGSIANVSDDAGFGWLQPFISSQVTGGGVLVEGGKDDPRFGGTSIQVVSDLGNGLSVGAGLENITGNTPERLRWVPGELGAGSPIFDREEFGPAYAGTAVGVVSYAGDGITAHVTGAAFGILDGVVDGWLVHAGATASFDAFRIRGAFGYEYNDITDASILNALVTGEATFDIFTLSLTGEYAEGENTAGFDEPIYGLAANAGFAVTDGVSVNLAARWIHNENRAPATAEDTYHVAAQLVASVTETIRLTGEVGAYYNEAGFPAGGTGVVATTEDSIYYGALEAAWNPGGGFSTSIKGEVFSTEAYRATFKASKSFE